jgi:sarcosine oxidase
LQGMPSIIYRLVDNPRLFSIYAVPPVLYPDGHIYVKIGGTLFHPNVRATQQELIEWFHTDGQSVETDAVREVLLDMLPGLRAEAFETRPCTTAYTAHEHPYIGALEDGPGGPRLFVAAGGSGSAAKSSNEIGRIAALLTERGSWASDLAEKHFEPVFL